MYIVTYINTLVLNWHWVPKKIIIIICYVYCDIYYTLVWNWDWVRMTHISPDSVLIASVLIPIQVPYACSPQTNSPPCLLHLDVVVVQVLHLDDVVVVVELQVLVLKLLVRRQKDRNQIFETLMMLSLVTDFGFLE